MTASQRCDWGDFPATILHFGAAASPCVDLRQEVAGVDRLALINSGLESSFGVVTAQDPMGVAQSPARNEQLAAKLRREVAGMGVPFIQVDAWSPDRSHCERSIAVAADRRQVLDLACRYRQLAIFWFDGTSFSIVPAVSEKQAVRLPIGEHVRERA